MPRAHSRGTARVQTRSGLPGVWVDRDPLSLALRLSRAHLVTQFERAAPPLAAGRAPLDNSGRAAADRVCGCPLPRGRVRVVIPHSR